MSEFIIDDREQHRFRVNRRVMVDPSVLERERTAIFDTSWLYVGHDTELPAPFDRVTRNVGGRPVIFLRDKDGVVRAFMNTCPHRGATLCHERDGSSRFLKCYYHAWSFDTTGALVALPDPDSYGPCFDRSELGLVPVPRLESYRGLWFLCFDRDAVDLESFLGGAREYIDLVVDQSPDGVEVIRGSHEYSMAANWKLLVENGVDGYHGYSLHQRYFEMVLNAGATFDMRATHGADLGGGHGLLMATTQLGLPVPEESADIEAARRAEIADRVGAKRAARMSGLRNLVIFPNLALNDVVGAISLRTYYPVRPDYMEVTSWELAPIGEDPALRKSRADSYLTFWGPGGLATPDDIEALQSCQRAFATHKEAQWSDVSRGMAKDAVTADDEAHIRGFWRRWNELVTGEVAIPEPHAPLPEPDVAAEVTV